MSEVDIGHELERLVGLARTDQLVGEAGLEPGRAVLFLKQERERTLRAFGCLLEATSREGERKRSDPVLVLRRSTRRSCSRLVGRLARRDLRIVD